MVRGRTGFTIIELVVVILIGSVLTSMALTSYGSVRGRFAVSGARNTYVALHARARAQAIEQGENVRLTAYPTGDSLVLETESGTRLEMIRYSGEFGVDIRATPVTVRVCMNSRGFADENCNNFTSATRVEFWAGTDSTSVEILPLGQLVY